MGWINILLVLLISRNTVLAQQGYDYARPSKAFPPNSNTNNNGPAQTTYSKPYGPTTQFPGASTTFVSNKHQTIGFPGNQVTYPSTQTQQYPSTHETPSYSRTTEYSGRQDHARNYPIAQTGDGRSFPVSQYQESQDDARNYPGSQYEEKFPGSRSQDDARNYPGTQTTRYPVSQYQEKFSGSQDDAGNYPGIGTQTTRYPGSLQYQERNYSGTPVVTEGRFPGSRTNQYPDDGGNYRGAVTTTGFPGSRYPGPGRTYPGADGTQTASYPGSRDGRYYESNYDDGDYSAIPGEPDVNYPIYSYIPETTFSCEQQQYPGYYADVETRCQVFHICANEKMYDFLCPNGTIFHQEYLVCVWWNQFDCNLAPSFYGINANIYDYSIFGQQGNLDYSRPAGPSQNNPNLNGRRYPDGSIDRDQTYFRNDSQQPADDRQGKTSRYPTPTREYGPQTQRGYSGPADANRVQDSLGYPNSGRPGGTFTGQTNLQKPMREYLPPIN